MEADILSHSTEQPFILGMDVSFMDEIEQHGGTYREADGKEEDLLTILKLNVPMRSVFVFGMILSVGSVIWNAL